MANYKDAGVDVEAGYKAVELMKKHIQKTMRSEVLTGIGGFGGLFSLEGISMRKPVLVSGTDGVGTKLKLAFLLDRHDTVGIDCVAMCVNDIICSGAQPLFFLDYIATGKNYPEKIESLVKGVAEGCQMAGCALIGGETAEMPGFYPEDEYDLAGFAVGIVDRDQIIDGSKIKHNDKLIGIASSGVHSNGFSLVRKLIPMDREALTKWHDDLNGCPGDVLLKPTKIYVKTILSLMEKFELKGIAHITGGGFIENLPRIVPEGFQITIHKGTWPVLPIFTMLQSLGGISENDMYNTFNMGIGMVLAVDPVEADSVVAALRELGEEAWCIGEIQKGEGCIRIC
ncbi:MAG: phosphoribosylformylglycinamidine cyclo-ligase [Clostridiaceae bacterium]|jgi:phosphoribosylformylglycinamidine cyclo-ligase|nr:phosphoribosylformylglycinamidine cyclo-ligase [Clostridiaceae bacterium]